MQYDTRKWRSSLKNNLFKKFLLYFFHPSIELNFRYKISYGVFLLIETNASTISDSYHAFQKIEWLVLVLSDIWSKQLIPYNKLKSDYLNFLYTYDTYASIPQNKRKSKEYFKRKRISSWLCILICCFPTIFDAFLNKS